MTYAAVQAATSEEKDALNGVLSVGREQRPELLEEDWWLDEQIVFGKGAMN